MNTTVTAAPSELDLTFSERLELKFSGVTIVGPDNRAVPTGKASLGGESDAVLVIPVTATLLPGAYRVDWHALSADGHKTNGSYTFTLQP